LYLPTRIFSHGQLYVAASRGDSPDVLRVFIPPDQREGGETYPDNVVYTDIFYD
jgi:hypothetical protein